MTTKASLTWTDKTRFLARSENSPTYVIDSDDNDGAACPMQMLLISLAGCTAIDVVEILTKKRIDLSRFEVNITGEEAVEHPQRYARIIVEYIFYGRGIKTKAVEQAIELSETKYCCALASVNAEASSSYRIIEE
jgi:putative redox protein